VDRQAGNQVATQSVSAACGRALATHGSFCFSLFFMFDMTANCLCGLSRQEAERERGRETERESGIKSKGDRPTQIAANSCSNSSNQTMTQP